MKSDTIVIADKITESGFDLLIPILKKIVTEYSDSIYTIEDQTTEKDIEKLSNLVGFLRTISQCAN